MEVLRQGLKPSVLTYNALISSCEKGQTPEQALKLYTDSHRQVITPDVITYNTLMSTCEKGTRAKKALELFVDMQR